MFADTFDICKLKCLLLPYFEIGNNFITMLYINLIGMTLKHHVL
jgi:hypothetical protein